MTVSYDPLKDTATFTCGSCGRLSHKSGAEVRRDDDVVIHCECGVQTTFKKSGRLAERRKRLGSEGHDLNTPKLRKPYRNYRMPMPFPSATSSGSTPDGRPRPKVLIADTDAVVVWLLERHLRQCGYQVVSLMDGRQVLDYVRREAPHVVLLDTILRGKSGLEVLRELKSEFPQMPIILITGIDSEFDRSKARILKSVHYLPKPFELQTVSEHVARVLSRSETGKS